VVVQAYLLDAAMKRTMPAHTTSYTAAMVSSIGVAESIVCPSR
jgi:hypothetical protein